MKKILFPLAAFAVLVALAPVGAQQRPPVPKTPRIYVFDNGAINGLDTKLFGFEKSEVKEANFTVQSYLVVHPRGTLMFDSGVVPDAELPADGSPVKEGASTVTKRLLPQLAAAGYKPSDITWFAMSHYHSDHTANADAFAGSTWIVQKADRDVMFAGQPVPIMKPAHFGALKAARTKLLDNEDFDVFGDGAVVIKSAPGHTPGHQVLFVRTANRGPIVLAGDLYHYPEERATGKTPSFEFNAEQSRATRAKIDAFLKQTNAQLWIEHDIATHAGLPKSPAYVD